MFKNIFNHFYLMHKSRFSYFHFEFEFHKVMTKLFVLLFIKIIQMFLLNNSFTLALSLGIFSNLTMQSIDK